MSVLRCATVAVCLSALLAGGPVRAEPSEAAMNLARRYVVAVRLETQMAAMMDNLMPALLDQSARRRGVTISGEYKAMFAKIASESAVAITPRMTEVMIPVVAETFSEAELQAAVDYYESPLGQAIIAKTPTFTAKVSPALTAIMPEMAADLEARLCREIGCEAAP